jgi:hypothetical protein
MINFNSYGYIITENAIIQERKPFKPKPRVRKVESISNTKGQTVDIYA